MKLVKKNILDFLEENGLDLNVKSGGKFVHYNTLTVKRESYDFCAYEINCNEEYSISVISPDMFYETFQETEKDLQMTLFG